jgi:type II secretory pathway pseudopilin PulG
MQVKNKFKKRSAFTIVELLTVMSVIIILISLLVPALSQVQKISKKVVQKKQFNSIDVALEMYKAEHGEYPDSSENGSDGLPYCGAMKLAEAMVGQDQLGFHRNSLFRSDLKDTQNNDLYQIPGNPPLPNLDQNLKMREGPYLPVEYANAQRMGDSLSGGDYYGIYEQLGYKPFQWYHLVLCDVYTRRIQGAGIKAGMPILYYKANPSGKTNPRRYDDGSTNAPYDNRDLTTNIYNYKDNDELVQLHAPWNADKTFQHPMDSTVPEGTANDGLGTTETFYYRINNNQVPIDTGRPYKADSYILLSAGYDGEYGTGDDIYSFE